MRQTELGNREWCVAQRRWAASIAFHASVDLASPSIDTAGQIADLIAALRPQPLRHLQAAHAVMADDDHAPIIGQLADPLGQLGHGDVDRAGEGADVALPWLPDVE